MNEEAVQHERSLNKRNEKKAEASEVETMPTATVEQLDAVLKRYLEVHGHNGCPPQCQELFDAMMAAPEFGPDVRQLADGYANQILNHFVVGDMDRVGGVVLSAIHKGIQLGMLIKR